MDKNKIQLAAIQETKLTSKSKPPKTPNYHLVRKDRKEENGGGGLAFLIHESLDFQREKDIPSLNDKFTEVQTIKIIGKPQSIHVRNVYIPPTSSCEQQYTPPINDIFSNLSENSIIIGDFNAHHHLWYTEGSEDARGKLIADTINGLPFGVVNEDVPTRTTANSQTSPDISFTSSSLLPNANWTLKPGLSSDHTPIIISLPTTAKYFHPQKRTFINFNKADWNSFKDMTEEDFSKTTPTGNVHKDEKTFRNIINKAAKRNIPAGRIPKVKNEVPTEAAELIEERDNLKSTDPSNPNINELNRNINKLIANHRKTKWREHLEKCHQGSKKLWTTIKGLGDHPKQPENQAIYFNGRPYNDNKKIASNFNAQFTPCANTKPTKAFRKTLRRLKRKPSDPKITITIAQTTKAIKSCKNSKALGPDGISPIMMKNLGPNGIKFLTSIYNQSVNKAIIPTIWKTGRIIPLLKPQKPSDQGPSFRPISLLSPPAKILESILLPEISASINFAPHQHGFRKGRSTTTALQTLSDKITKGLNMLKPVDRTVVVAIDLSKAFDTVNHEILLQDILELNLNNNIKRFLTAYIRGRQTFVEFRNKRSKFRKMRQGVPQGGVLSPILFNLYMSKMPPPPTGISLVTYADDSNVLTSGTNIKQMCNNLNQYLQTLDTWFKDRNLFISPAKSSATLFSTAPNEMNLKLPIKINNEEVPTVKHPKFLGVTFDSTLSFKFHSDNMKDKINSRNNILKALSGTTWGKDKETLLETYKATSKSIMSYCAPIYSPNLKDSNWTNLQAAQNQALRTALGCVNKTSIDHLHTESKLLPVKEHCEMLSKQFLLATQKPDHPNQRSLNLLTPPRIMKHTLDTKHSNSIKSILPNGIADEDTYKRKLKEIHTATVSTSINNQNANKVLNSAPPPIDPSEKSLPRRTRTLLSQLRSGYSSFLNSYLHAINAADTDKCPKCHLETHTTDHLFNCSANMTDLTVHSLWTSPRDAATFLGLATEEEPSDDHG